MEALTVGSVVVTSFPFSNLKAHKNRPALVLGFSDFNDVVLCQITSIADGELKKVQIDDSSFLVGGLHSVSYIRPDKLFTADRSIIVKSLGKLRLDVIGEVKIILKKFFAL